MLSRVAENLYWIGRYLQRAENTARLVNVHSHLLMDIPPKALTGWRPLIEIVGAERTFAELYQEPSEANVIRFLLIDDRNPGSVVSSLRAAREGLRTTRDIMPREIWERVNDAYHWLKDSSERSLQRRWRRDFLQRVIDMNLLTLGTLVSSMSRDVGYHFLSLGLNLEQADMTTRILDARTASLIEPLAGETLRPFESIQWMSILKSLTGYQMYRQHAKRRVSGAQVLCFLLQDSRFPRSVRFCLDQCADVHLKELPARPEVNKELGRVRKHVQGADLDGLISEGLSGYLDNIQRNLGTLHQVVHQAYFHR